MSVDVKQVKFLGAGYSDMDWSPSVALKAGQGAVLVRVDSLVELRRVLSLLSLKRKP